MNNNLSHKITEFKRWREQLSRNIAEYRDWLGTADLQNSMEELRLYDIEQALQRDKLVLAFVAEFSRGKTEAINALFFADFKQRLLPSDPGRTTMCPTEIFWDDREQPYIKLLPIETRKNDNGLSFLKAQSQEWSTIRLDINSPDSMKTAFQSIIQQKEVSHDEAKALGLWDENDATMQQRDGITVPAWRHALINFPHPLLKSGLVILDTPGLNALGTEPELTLNIIPNAHAVIFLIATDTGVTKSDIQVWHHYIGNRNHHKIAVLNKIDILWDALKSQAEIDAEIDAQVRLTAQQLNLPASSVLAMSAQKALLAKVKNDAALLARSGITKLEKLLAEQVVDAKHDILRRTIVLETSELIKDSRRVIQQRLHAARNQLHELQSLRGKNQDVVKALITEVGRNRKQHDASVQTFQQDSKAIVGLSKQILHLLEQEHLQRLLDTSRREIGDSWTTMGLNQGIKGLVKKTAQLVEQINQSSGTIQQQAEKLYLLFKNKHHFELQPPPRLDMSAFTQQMQALEAITEAFCRDPVNVMTEKHFLIRKFFLSLGRQVENVFAAAFRHANSWLSGVLTPLRQQISEHRASLEKRNRSLLKIHQNMSALQTSISAAEQAMATLQSQSAALDKLLLQLMHAAMPARTETTRPAAATTPA